MQKGFSCPFLLCGTDVVLGFGIGPVILFLAGIATKGLRLSEYLNYWLIIAESVGFLLSTLKVNFSFF